MTARNFLRRSCGQWTSERRYLFAPKFTPVNLVTRFTFESIEYGKFRVDWKGSTEGVMDLSLEGDILHRSRDYFGEGANSSKVQVIDEDCIVMRTEYDGCRFREEVRFVENDFFRHRFTVGFNLTTGQLVLQGSYWETRL
jgi:hypothetical protein